MFCMLLLGLFAPAALAVESKSADKRIAVHVNNKPLGEVLTSISRSTGYAFVLDDSWRSYPVTAHIEDIPLHTGLKRLLNGLNHAIVYLPDGRIKILILDGPSGGSAPGSQPAARPFLEAPVSKPPRSPARSISPAPPARSSKPAPPVSPDSGAPEREEAEPDPGNQPGEEDTQD
jgi:hypothetical protein